MATKFCRWCGLDRDAIDFYPNKNCKSGFLNKCKMCVKGYQKSYNQTPEGRAIVKANRAVRADRIKAQQKAWRQANPDKFREIVKRAHHKNPEAIRASRRRWEERNLDRVKATKAAYAKRPEHRAKQAVRAAVKIYLKKYVADGAIRPGALRHMPWTIDQLKTHLEQNFLPGMTWENYGRGGWHIDHIEPLARFKGATPGSPEFEHVWGLENLQPLWEIDNFAKGAKPMAEFIFT